MKVSWDDDIHNMMGKIKAMFQTTNQISYRTFQTLPSPFPKADPTFAIFRCKIRQKNVIYKWG